MLPSATPEPVVAADLVLLNGKVWTVDPRSSRSTGGRGLATIASSKWAATPKSNRSLAPNTHVIDLNGRRVLPGFHDSHLHFLGGGQQLSARSSSKTRRTRRSSASDSKNSIASCRAIAGSLGGNWDHDRTFGGKLPTAAIDRQVRQGPARLHPPLRRPHGPGQHRGAQAGRRSPPRRRTCAGGVIYRLADGKTPTGILRDNAMGLVDPTDPGAGLEEIVEHVLAAMRSSRRERHHQRAGHGRQRRRHAAKAVPRSTSSWLATAS